ncbi:TonB-dependent receptor [Sphingomonas adhaesiva]|uniref:TonB-dependent receptor n=1 Tax=Sphingomonas adhaesiva TaxID=28212 RepID=UPI002FFC955C
MKKFDLLCASAIGLLAAAPAAAQTGATTSAQNSAPTNGPGQEVSSNQSSGYAPDIVVTAQRQSQRLQDVPIAVTAFTADNLEKQQVVNSLALQQTLPNTTFTRGNFGGNTFTIRGVGDLCVGVTCDSATGIHINDQPLLGSRILDFEFFDLERIEVLRGPQGTLFGRNATSGVVNLITAKPDLSGIRAAGEFEYGNYDSKRVRGMINVPLTETIGVRVAGTYLNRDGFTRNTYTGRRIDGRDMYSLRGTLSWEPSPDTRIDIIANYSKENDNRSRIQKQLCNRDSSGILGCSPDRLGFDTVNGNATLASTLGSREGIGLLTALSVVPAATAGGLPAALAPQLVAYAQNFGLGSIYDTNDAFSRSVVSPNVREVSLDYEPFYRVEEQIYTAKLFHDFGPMSVSLTAGYLRNTFDSGVDYNLAVRNPIATNTGLAFLALNAARPGNPYAAIARALIPNGPTGGICQSAFDGPTGVGVYGGNTVTCSAQGVDADRQTGNSRQYTIEGHIDSKFDGPFNFLLGGIYVNNKVRDVDYYVGNFEAFDYTLGGIVTNLVPGFLNFATGAPAATTTFQATPYFRSNSALFRLRSYGVFGEAYFEPSDKLKLTVGLRYNNDKKYVSARTTTDNVAVPIGTTNATSALDRFDFDGVTPGQQPFQIGEVAFQRLTGRAVIDYKITPDNLLYASYSRGYKSGGVNPPITPGLGVGQFFAPENVDAIEVGSKNTFGNGQFRFNLTAFYYKYKNLQLTRIVNRTSVNDNINANIYGVEAEAIISPTPAFVVNANFSYSRSKVAGDQFIVNPRDVSGGRSDAVIIKDLQARNCAVIPTTAGQSAVSNGFVNGANAALNAQFPTLGLRGTVPVPGTNTTGAFSSCDYLAAVAAATGAPVSVLQGGVAVNLRDNQLPNTPTYKASIGAQYTIDLGNFTLVPRADLNYTGNYFGTIFNKSPIDRIPGYEVVNAQVQLNAPDDRFYVRAFVTNLTNNNAITGMYVTDQSSGLFTNVFTVDPRRYGIAAGFKF